MRAVLIVDHHDHCLDATRLIAALRTLADSPQMIVGDAMPASMLEDLREAIGQLKMSFMDELPEAAIAPLVVLEEENWSRCSPELLRSGVNCASSPRAWDPLTKTHYHPRADPRLSALTEYYQAHQQLLKARQLEREASSQHTTGFINPLNVAEDRRPGVTANNVCLRSSADAARDDLISAEQRFAAAAEALGADQAPRLERLHRR